MTVGQTLKAAGETTGAEVAAGGYLTIQPPVGAEWFITKIFGNGPFTLYFYDGAEIQIYNISQGGSVPKELLDVAINHDQYFKVKNTDTTSHRYSFLGYEWS